MGIKYNKKMSDFDVSNTVIKIKRIFRSQADVSARARSYNFRANRTNGYRVHFKYIILIKNDPLN